jgi:ABC-2 type transport system permease protein
VTTQADSTRHRFAVLTLIRIAWINLTRDRVAQAMTFLLPIIFFSIFATVFGNQGNAQTTRIRVAVVDEDQSELSRRMIEGMRKESGLRVRTSATDDAGGVVLDRPAAERLVRSGDVPVAVVIPHGLGAAFGQSGFGGGPAMVLLADPSDPIAPNVVGGLLQKVTMTAAPDLMMQGGIRQFEAYAGQLTPQQKAAVDAWMPRLKAGEASSTPGTAGGAAMGVTVQVIDVMRSNTQRGSLVSFYAAGVGVMFLLFSMVGAAGGVLLEEAESGTLERLLCTDLGMSGILLGKWAFLVLVGSAQLSVMFLWADLVFGLPLFSHLPGFIIMTLVTASAAAALALILATLARSRAQLSGFSTILILTMSALGGSMFPRFLMSETMQKIGLVTFNAWALDGYLKVFWRDAPVWQLWPQLAVLSGLAVVFLSGARVIARKWEAV